MREREGKGEESTGLTGERSTGLTGESSTGSTGEAIMDAGQRERGEGRGEERRFFGLQRRGE